MLKENQPHSHYNKFECRWFVYMPHTRLMIDEVLYDLRLMPYATYHDTEYYTVFKNYERMYSLYVLDSIDMSGRK
jgi:hypothetical protein